MTVSSLHQLEVFGIYAAAGLGLGVLAVFLKTLREEIGGGSIFAAFTDFFFWLSATLGVIWLSLGFNDGQIMAGQLLAAACGLLLHALLLRGITARLSLILVRALGFILKPVSFLCRGTVLYIKNITEKISKTALKIGQKVKRMTSAEKFRKKIRKNYKKML